MVYYVVIYNIFTSFAICKTFKTFKIIFLKMKQIQQLNTTPDFALIWYRDLNLYDEAKLLLQLSEIFTIAGEQLMFMASN